MKLPERRSGSMIGLDIGSSAVRAVEVSRGRHGLAVSRFGQVGLPAGAVAGAEVADPAAVASAIRRLWSEVGFSSRRAVVAISGQRVIVRRAEVPAMSTHDFRSALGFQAMDLIPIPVDDAVLDFVVLPERQGSKVTGDRMDIVLAAAHRGTVQGHIAALSGAGVHPVALVPAPGAVAPLLRRLEVGDEGPAAFIDIGADVTVVTVVEDGAVRFSRILGSGGSALTDALATRKSIGRPDAESAKRRASAVSLDELPPLIGEVESTLSFFASQLDHPLGQVLLTGGGTRDEGLVEHLAGHLPFNVGLLDPFDRVDLSGAELTDDAVAAARALSAVALGCAEWAWAAPANRLSLLPGEHAAAARHRRQLAAVGLGIVVLAGGLTVAGLHRESSVRHQQSLVKASTASNVALNARQVALEPVETASTSIQQRLAVLAQAEQGDVAWSQLLSEISAAMPPQAQLTSLSFTGPASGASSASTSTGSSNGTYGSLTMAVKVPGTEDQVAVWLRAFRNVPGLEAIWVPSASASSGTVTFTSTGGLVAGVPLVHRSELQP